jgi:hypothetical protein
MKYSGTYFCGFLTLLLLGITIRGLRKGDYSASGIKITRASEPKTFWFYFVYYSLVSAFLILVTAWQYAKNSKEP